MTRTQMVTEKRWGWIDNEDNLHVARSPRWSRQRISGALGPDEFVVLVTLTYTRPAREEER